MSYPLRRPDVVVCGVGRTGTSYTARILQEHFGIYMCAPEHNKFCGANPKGGYEDTKMLRHSYALVEKPGYTVDEWLYHYDKYYGEIEGLVGIKQTPFSLLSYQQWEELNPKLVIRTHRSDLLAVESMVRVRVPKDREKWQKFYNKREACMMKHLDGPDGFHSFPVGTVYFGSQQLEDWKMINWLEYHIKRAGIDYEESL